MDNIKKILVTGNMGYIGPVLTSYLRENHPGIEIYGLDLGFFGQCLTGAPVIPESRVDVQYISDVRKREREREGAKTQSLCKTKNPPRPTWRESAQLSSKLDS